MIIKINGEQQFQVLADSFSISPSNEGYQLQISADGVNFTTLFTVGANITRLVSSVASGSYYRCLGNATELTVNWRNSHSGGGGGEYTLPIASETTLGGIKIGDGLSIDSDGKVSSEGGGYTLPTASPTVLGGVKIGSGLTIENGVLSTSGGSSEADSTKLLAVNELPTSGVSAGTVMALSDAVYQADVVSTDTYTDTITFPFSRLRFKKDTTSYHQFRIGGNDATYGPINIGATFSWDADSQSWDTEHNMIDGDSNWTITYDATYPQLFTAHYKNSDNYTLATISAYADANGYILIRLFTSVSNSEVYFSSEWGGSGYVEILEKARGTYWIEVGPYTLPIAANTLGGVLINNNHSRGMSISTDTGELSGPLYNMLYITDSAGTVDFWNSYMLFYYLIDSSKKNSVDKSNFNDGLSINYLDSSIEEESKQNASRGSLTQYYGYQKSDEGVETFYIEGEVYVGETLYEGKWNINMQSALADVVYFRAKDITAIKKLTQDEYDALTTKDNNTIYIITD